MKDPYTRLIDLLDGRGVQYRVIDHAAEGRTELVSAMRGHELRLAAKCMVVMVKVGRKVTRHVLAVDAAFPTPATSCFQLSLPVLRSRAGADMKAAVTLSVVFAASLALCVPAPVAAQTAQTSHEMHRLHGDARAYIAALEDPKRDAYQKPHEVMEALAVRQGEVIADIGAGSGYFSVRLAHHVGKAGRVYAVDVSPEMIGHLHRRVRDMQLLNVSPILAPPDDPLLPEPVDRFLIVDVWHHIENQPAYLEQMKARLKPGGQVVMIDFQKRELPVGPPPGMKIAREDLIEQMNAHGFRLAVEHTFLPYQYFLVFEVSGGAPGL